MEQTLETISKAIQEIFIEAAWINIWLDKVVISFKRIFCEKPRLAFTWGSDNIDIEGLLSSKQNCQAHFNSYPGLGHTGTV